MHPVLSVVIPSLNQAGFLRRSLESVVSQVRPNDEVIVVDGGSTDGSAEIIREYDGRLAWWVSEPDAGQSAALNKGFRRARGEFLLWLNADDVLLPGAIDAIAAHLDRHPGCRWLAANTVYLDEHDRVLWCARGPRWHGALIRRGPVYVYGPTSVFRRDAFEAVGGFDESLRYVMDVDLWLRFAAQGLRFERLSRYGWGFRVHAGSKTAHSLRGPPDGPMAAEWGSVYRRHAHRVTRGGIALQAAWKLASGCYARAWFDTRRWRGKRADEALEAASNARAQRRDGTRAGST